MMSNHLKFINLAHEFALKNLGKTFPNPSVGCVISKNNKIISKGVTSSTGRPHAEEIAIFTLVNGFFLERLLKKKLFVIIVLFF